VFVGLLAVDTLVDPDVLRKLIRTFVLDPHVLETGVLLSPASHTAAVAEEPTGGYRVGRVIDLGDNRVQHVLTTFLR